MPFLRVSSASVETVQRTTFCSGQVALYTTAAGSVGACSRRWNRRACWTLSTSPMERKMTMVAPCAASFASCSRLRDGGAALHAGDDDGLAHIGQGVLGTERRRCAAEAGHARGVIVGDAVGVQRVHLLPDGPVKAGVAGVEADGGAARLLRSAAWLSSTCSSVISALL